MLSIDTSASACSDPNVSLPAIRGAGCVDGIPVGILDNTACKALSMLGVPVPSTPPPTANASQLLAHETR